MPEATTDIEVGEFGNELAEAVADCELIRRGWSCSLTT
jgi:hypothetical protein